MIVDMELSFTHIKDASANILKGFYKENPKNRKLGRVGREYDKKKEEKEKKETTSSSKKKVNGRRIDPEYARRIHEDAKRYHESEKTPGGPQKDGSFLVTRHFMNNHSLEEINKILTEHLKSIKPKK